MLLADLIPDADVIDTRSHLRDLFAPEAVTVVALGDGSTAELLDVCLAIRPAPAALVLEDGRLWILSAGGSGMVAHSGDSLNDDQRLVVERVTAALVEMGAAPLDVEIVEDQPVRQRSRRSKKQDPTEVEVTRVETEPAAEPAWTVDESGVPF